MDERGLLQAAWAEGSLINRRRILQLVAAGASSLALAAAFKSGSAFAQETESSSFGEPTTTGGTAIIAVGGLGAPRLFVPTSYYGTVAFFVSKLTTTPLITLDSSWANMGPAIAKSWEVSDDGMQVTFLLRDDVAFHDGELLNAEDVVFTYKLMTRLDEYPAVRDVTILQGGKEYKEGTSEELPGVEALDDFTVRFNLTSPSNVFLLNVSTCGIVPAHKFSPDVLTSGTPIHELPYFSWESEPPIGTGPWKITEYDPQSFLSLSANEQYFRGRPILDSLTLRLNLEASAMVAGMQAGEFDSAYVTIDAAKSMEDTDHIELIVNHDLANEQVFINATEKEYLSVPVRQALLHAIDLDSLIATVTYGYGRPAPSVMMHASLFPNADLPTYPYDQEKAKQLLAEAGWDPARSLKFGQFVAQGAPVAVISAIMSMWRDVGVNTEFVALDPANQLEISKQEDHPYDVVMTGFAWLAYDPSTSYSSFASSKRPNYSNYNNPEFDQLMEEAIRIPNMEDAVATYQQAQTIIQRDLPYSPVYITPDIWSVNKKLHGGVLGRGPLNDIQTELWWKE